MQKISLFLHSRVEHTNKKRIKKDLHNSKKSSTFAPAKGCFRQRECKSHIADLSNSVFSVEGMSKIDSNRLKSQKNGQKSHKITKKLRTRLRISKKNCNFVRFLSFVNSFDTNNGIFITNIQTNGRKQRFD